MYKYKVTFVSTSRTVFFRAESPDAEAIQNFIEDLLLIFSEFDEQQQLYNIQGFHVSNPELLSKTDELIIKYSPMLPGVKKIGAYLSTLRSGQNFFFFPKENLSTREIMIIQDNLRSLDENEDVEKILEGSKERWGDLLDNYSIDYCSGTKRFIGEPKKERRICRFCSKGHPETSFKKKAHAISEGLGNKAVILWDECDGCNEDFGSRIEPHLIEYLALFRTIYGANEREKSKTLKGANFSLKNDGNPTISIVGDHIQKKDELPYELDLIGHQKVISQNIYKSLCKFALSIMDVKYLQHFQKTKEWVSSDSFAEQLPKIGDVLYYGGSSDHPTLYLMIRQSENKNLPFAVGVLQYTCRLMLFVLPFSNQDDHDFLGDNHIQEMRKIFKPFSVENMSFNDFSNYTPRTLNLHLVFDVE